MWSDVLLGTSELGHRPEIGRLYPGWRVCSGRVKRGLAWLSEVLWRPLVATQRYHGPRSAWCAWVQRSYMYTGCAHTHTKKGTEWAVEMGTGKKEVQEGRSHSGPTYLLGSVPPSPTPPILLQTTLLSPLIQGWAAVLKLWCEQESTESLSAQHLGSSLRVSDY